MNRLGDEKESVLGEPSQKIRLIEKEPEFPSVSDKNDQMNDLKKKMNAACFCSNPSPGSVKCVTE